MRHRPGLSGLDLALLLIVAGLAGWFGHSVVTGVDYNWDWGVIPQYMFRHDPERGWVPSLLMQGLFTTIRLSLWATVLATVIGTILGLCRVSRSLFNRLIGRTYVEFVRNIPPLVWVFVFYFFFSDQILPLVGAEGFVRSRSEGVQQFLAVVLAPPGQVAAFLSAVLTLALYEASYITEIIRSGIQSIERGQWEAAHALGLSPWQRMRHVILPQAMRRVLPPMTGQFISTIKDSAIVSVISIQELTFQGMELMAATYRTYEIWITITLLYLALTLSLSLVARKLELKLERSEA